MSDDTDQQCAFCGRPGDHPPCCTKHNRPQCSTCSSVPGGYLHRDPANIGAGDGQ